MQTILTMELLLLLMILEMSLMIKKPTIIFSEKYIGEREDSKLSSRQRNRIDMTYCLIPKINDTISR